MNSVRHLRSVVVGVTNYLAVRGLQSSSINRRLFYAFAAQGSRTSILESIKITSVYHVNEVRNTNQDAAAAVKAVKKKYDLSYEDLEALLKAKDIQLIDVREVKEIEEYGQIPDSINIPLGQVKDALSMAPDKFKQVFRANKPSETDDNIVFSCLGGVRSKKAQLIAQELGIKKARNYLGGWEDYSKRKGLPLKKNEPK